MVEMFAVYRGPADTQWVKSLHLQCSVPQGNCTSVTHQKPGLLAIWSTAKSITRLHLTYCVWLGSWRKQGQRCGLSISRRRQWVHVTSGRETGWAARDSYELDPTEPYQACRLNTISRMLGLRPHIQSHATDQKKKKRF